ncbi:MAG: polysaccharide lyase [Bacteroidales bacterium]|nr:polysaccharide lyase [Bacteroidales bacterium]
MKFSLILSFMLVATLPAWAQYPTIPDSAKVRGAQQQALWDSLDNVAWQKAVPTVMQDMLNGKPFVPWCATPEMLRQAPIPAFPGAIGGGRYSFGGRGGKVFVVTSLADSGPGTLREACETGGARIVVFNVAGEIRLERPIHVRAPYISIYGQTAPGDGVVITGQSLLIDTHDVIIRYMRFRRGSMDVAFRDDACGGNGLGNIIYDHCSASWGLDEVMSMYRHVYARKANGYGEKLPTVNITIQDCIFAEGLDLYNHGFGASIGGHNSLFARNLFANNISRNPSIAMNGGFNFVNNVLFNWWNRSIDGGDNTSCFNIVNNYFKPGPITGYDTEKKAVDPEASIRWRILKPECGRSKEQQALFGKAYVTGNIVEGNAKVTADNWDGGIQPPGLKDKAVIAQTLKVDAPHPMPYLDTLYSASEAFEYVLENVGATKPVRDAVDARIVRSVRRGEPTYVKGAKEHTSPYVRRRLPADSYKMGIITDPQQVGGLPAYKGKPHKDTDGDGIPDNWEKANGLNPNDSTDALIIRADGYMNIEWYANSL